MPAGEYDIRVEQGATFQRTITWSDSVGNPIDLTGYTARLQMRNNLNDPTPFLDLTTENGGITLGGAQGTVTLLATDEQTSAIDSKKGVYDLEIELSDGSVVRLLAGKVTVSYEVTR